MFLIARDNFSPRLLEISEPQLIFDSGWSKGRKAHESFSCVFFASFFLPFLFLGERKRSIKHPTQDVIFYLANSEDHFPFLPGEDRVPDLRKVRISLFEWKTTGALFEQNDLLLQRNSGK